MTAAFPSPTKSSDCDGGDDVRRTGEKKSFRTGRSEVSLSSAAIIEGGSHPSPPPLPPHLSQDGGQQLHGLQTLRGRRGGWGREGGSQGVGMGRPPRSTALPPYPKAPKWPHGEIP